MSLTVDTERLAVPGRGQTASPCLSLLLIDLGDVVRHDLAAYLEHNRFSLTAKASLDALYEAGDTGLDAFDAVVLVAHLPNPDVLAAIRHMSDGDGPPLLGPAAQGGQLRHSHALAPDDLEKHRQLAKAQPRCRPLDLGQHRQNRLRHAFRFIHDIAPKPTHIMAHALIAPTQQPPAWSISGVGTSCLKGASSH